MFDQRLPIHDPVLIFALVMVIVLVAPLFFERLRVPGLVGLIFCGAIVGPSGLGLLERDSTMVLLGTVGLLYLMFVAGLNLDLNQFHRLRNQSLTFGLLSFLVPQLMGIAAGLYVLGYGFATSVLLGSIVGSHTLLAYPIASRLGITKNTAVIMTMGGTIVTDLLALLLLAVVVGAAKGALDALFWIRFLGLVLVYFFVVLVGLPRLGRWFLRATRNEPNVAFVFLVAALFVTAYLASLAGLAPIIGAFLAGIVLNRLVPEIGPLMTRVKFVGEALFIPFFLLSVGMLVDFGVLAGSLAVWQAALTFTLIVVIGKGLAARIAQRVFRYTAAEGWTVFGLSIPQAAATLAVTLVGFDLGLFDQTAVNAVVVLIFLTCLLGPWLVRRYGSEVALLEEQRPYQPSEAPERILIPLSNPATSEALVEVALAIRRAGSEEPVFPLSVVRDDRNVEHGVADAEKLVSQAVLHAVASDVPVIPMTRVDPSVAHGIARAISERRISHVVIGWGGQPSARQRIFGSILDGLLDLSRATVLVCRLNHPLNTHARVVLAVPPLAEREPGFDEALRTIKRLAYRIGANLEVLSTEKHTTAVMQHVRAARPDVPVTSSTLTSWGDLVSLLVERLTTTDLLVLLSARERQGAWHPSLDRLPRHFSQQLPATDFMVIYPSEADVRGSPETTSDSELPPVHVVEDLETGALGDVLRVMVATVFSNDPARCRSIVSELLRTSQAYRSELVPGVALLHTHSALVSGEVLVAGTSRHGIVIPGSSTPVHLLFVLLSPLDRAPEEHLRTLANLARRLRSCEELQDFDSLTRPEELRRRLSLKAPSSDGSAR